MNIDSLPLTNGIYTLEYGDLTLDINLNLDKKSDYIYFCFAGAKPLDKGVPYFNRWTWSHIFHSNIVSISDPTLSNFNKLNIGWYLNKGEIDIYEKLAFFIRKIANKLGYSENQMILYGSSAGGFASLKCAPYLPNARVISINPQTDISKYFKQHYSALIRFLPNLEDELISVSGRLDNVLLCQNVVDEFHYDNHFMPLIKKNPFIKHYIYNHENGHGSEPSEIISYLLIKSMEDIDKLDLKSIDISFNQVSITNASEVNSVQDDKIYFLPLGRKDLDVSRIEYPIDWACDPYNDRNWKFQFNMWRFWDTNLKGYNATKDSKYVVPLRKVIRSWYDYHIVNNKKNDFLVADMAMGGRALRLAYYMAIDSEFIESDREYRGVVQKVFNQHLLLLLDFNNIKFSNHTLTDIHGLMALSKCLKPFFKKIIEYYINQIFPKLLKMQFSDDGFHKENSPEYHFYAINCFASLKRSGWFEKYNLSEILNKAKVNKQLFYLPDGRILPFGDSTNTQMDWSGETYYKINSYQIMNHAGYFIFRKNDAKNMIKDSSYFAVMAGLRSRFHKQNDDLSFIWFEGEDIIRDFGKFAYKSDKMRGYAIMAESHNSVLFNSKNMYKGNFIEDDQFFDNAVLNYSYENGALSLDLEVCYDSSNIPMINRGIKHSRFFEYKPGKELKIIDSVIAPNKSKIEQFFHFGKFWVVEEVKDNILMLKSNYSGKYLRLEIDRRAIFCLYYGSTDPIQGWSSNSYGKAEPSFSLKIEWGEGQLDSTQVFSLI